VPRARTDDPLAGVVYDRIWSAAASSVVCVMTVFGVAVFFRWVSCGKQRALGRTLFLAVAFSPPSVFVVSVHRGDGVIRPMFETIYLTTEAGRMRDLNGGAFWASGDCQRGMFCCRTV